jgi:hypothetical protein
MAPSRVGLFGLAVFAMVVRCFFASGSGRTARARSKSAFAGVAKQLAKLTDAEYPFRIK